MGNFEILARRLKELRNGMQLTQKEFADKVGFTQATLSAYENNQKKPSLDIVKDIAEKCNISIDWLCGLSDKKNNDDTIETYSDAIRLIIKLCETYFPFGQWEILCHISEIEDLSIGDTDYAVLRCPDEDMVTFFKDWIQIKSLYSKGTITEHLYKLWIDDKLKEYDKYINPLEAPFDSEAPSDDESLE